MKIAIVAPSSVPYVIGGAENLWWGLQAALNARPGIEAELIKLPSPERNLAEILASYRRFAALDLLHFDLVISTKYPAWAIRHPNHVVYLQHTLRGLYDTYPDHLPASFDSGAAAALGLPAPVIEALRLTRPGDLTVDAVTEALQAAMQHAPDSSLWAFPGAFSRAVVHLLDAIAMQPGHIAHYGAIAETVARRQDYFPAGAKVSVHHHPTGLKKADHPAGGPVHEGIFSASRLDRPKRIDLVIEGYLRAEVDVPLRIAGSGPDEARLRALAGGHPNIHFLGRLTDAQLAQEYARALFVPFMPRDEDYGLITVEAMQAGKAVLTTADAGGPTELVTHGQNGLVVPPEAGAVAAAMRQLCHDRNATIEMGMLGAARIAPVTWEGLCEAMLSWSRKPAATTAAPAIGAKAKPVVAVINTFPIAPAVSGGKLRLYGLYRQVAQTFAVHFVNLGPPHLPRHVRELGPGFVEEVVPKSKAFGAEAISLEQKVGASAEDLAAALKPELVPEWLEAIDRAARSADIVVCSHPYGYPALRRVSKVPFVYESHNVESDLKRGIYGRHEWATELVRWVEQQACWEARAITACSDEDAARLRELYRLDNPHLCIETVPNGIDLGAVPFRPASVKAMRRAVMRTDRPVALFMGSAHGPNIEAAHAILAAAAQAPGIDFVLMGSVCHAVADAPRTPNVGLVGVVSDAEKAMWLDVAEFGLNPVVSGSGTNLKLVEYAAAGLLVVGTPFGARGSAFVAGEHYLAAENAALAEGLRQALALPEETRNRIIAAAYATIRDSGDWRGIAAGYVKLLERVLAG
ncbi:group 1 glycosyl transferase [Cupriavidus necator]|uniref:Group 1 glycosyl transferase n=1 Tax=Cupriavidus necator TaxID=106590 RepID=A0A1U9UUW9_CUPNE|nr:glycosyltransferase [Cupriavidus necator]AQV96484.1 group 1 glycosyl transferase [Cupriavidus necator]